MLALNVALGVAFQQSITELPQRSKYNAATHKSFRHNDYFQR